MAVKNEKSTAARPCSITCAATELRVACLWVVFPEVCRSACRPVGACNKSDYAVLTAKALLEDTSTKSLWSALAETMHMCQHCAAAVRDRLGNTLVKRILHRLCIVSASTLLSSHCAESGHDLLVLWAYQEVMQGFLFRAAEGQAAGLAFPGQADQRINGAARQQKIVAH